MTRTTTFDREASPALEIYLGEIQGGSLLTAEEEKALASRVAAGDDSARSRLIRSNLRLVVKIARQYAGRGLAMDDLVGEGNLGLIRAAEEFDPGFGTRFSTYAAYWIKQAIRHALTNTAATIRLPAHMVGLLARWRKAERALRRDGVEPDADRVADALGLSGVQRDLVARAFRARRLVREAVGDDAEAWSPDEVCDPSGPTDEALADAEERRQVLRRLDRLDDRERTILALRFGLGGGDPLTLKEIGRRLGVTREWVRKIEHRAVRKLDDAPERAAIA